MAKKSEEFRPMRVDVLISNMPYKLYEQIRDKLTKEGYHVQGYQPKYYEGHNDKSIL